MAEPYYAAYEERYKTAHAQGVSWASNHTTPIVLETLTKYQVNRDASLLEIGCGEGRDAIAVLQAGYNLLATDLSKEAIRFCREKAPQFAERFQVLDCLSDSLGQRYDFLYAVAVLHMLVLDEDRERFYQFIADHMKPDGIAFICTMGDGVHSFQTDISEAFTLQERNHESGKMLVAATSCRMVSFDTFYRELRENGFTVLESGLTAAPPEFDSLLYAVVRTSGTQEKGEG